jgi:hypothetical protein
MAMGGYHIVTNADLTFFIARRFSDAEIPRGRHSAAAEGSGRVETAQASRRISDQAARATATSV